jgi:hypothetical protein
MWQRKGTGNANVQKNRIKELVNVPTNGLLSIVDEDYLLCPVVGTLCSNVCGLLLWSVVISVSRALVWGAFLWKHTKIVNQLLSRKDGRKSMSRRGHSAQVETVRFT